MIGLCGYCCIVVLLYCYTYFAYNKSLTGAIMLNTL